MKISDLFRMGLKNLTRRKTRTILTTMGVIIGSLCIIITISIGNGINYNYKELVMTQGGLTTITIDSTSYNVDDDGNYVNSTETKLDDALIEKIKAIKHVKAVSPIIQPQAELWCGKYRSWVQLYAMDMSACKDFNFPDLEYGQYPSDEDDQYIVFGTSATEQFSDSTSNSMYSRSVSVDPREKKVELKFTQFSNSYTDTVVDSGSSTEASTGTTSSASKKKDFSLPLKNIAKMKESKSQYDWSVYIDINYFKQIYEKYCSTLSTADRKKAIKLIQTYSQIQLNTDNINNIEEVQDEIKKMGLQSYSDIQYLNPLKKASENIQLILLVMGIIVMFASAISIANTMVMSIYERTKEIGIMKVLGCTISDIRKLFLFEAAIIGLLGGIIGIILGYVTSWAINSFGAPIFSTLMSGNFTGDITDTKFSIIPLYLPFISLMISIGVGLVSGYFPARRATKIKAIEAMKTEG